MSGATDTGTRFWIALRRMLILSGAVGVLLALTDVAAASAEMPWWGLTSSARPTNLSAGSAKDEVQQLTVRATGGKFALVETQNGQPNFEHHTILPYNATASEVQEHLEAEVYPFRKVTVTGGPGDETGSKPYVITFPGQALEPMLTLSGLSGGSPESKATIRELAHGADDGEIVLSAENLGDGEINGASTQLTIADKLPPGVSATSIEGTAEKAAIAREPLHCSIASLSCTFSGTLAPFETLQAVVSVEVSGAVSGEDNDATVTGGGAATASASQSLRISAEPTRFGVEQYAFSLEEEGGSPDTQAGSHPFQVTSTLALNQTADPRMPPAPIKDLRLELPPGLVGNVSAVPQCTEQQFDTARQGGSDFCPADTAIGVATVTISLHGVSTGEVPVFNLTPAVGEPARFGFLVEGSPVILDTSVRTGGDYGVVVSADNLTQLVGLISSRVTLWGVPGDPRHDASRGWECVAGSSHHVETSPQCGSLGLLNPPPFLTLPTSCSGPLQTAIQADSWEEPGNFLPPTYYTFPQNGAGEALGIDGCNRLSFTPAIEVTPEKAAASTPTGIAVGVHVPQESSEATGGLVEANVKDTTVTLPEGMQLSPAGANGLEACSEAEIGFSGVEPDGMDLFTPGLPQPFCPDASKVGTVKIETPLLPNPLEGAVYLADPAPAREAGRNPFDSLLAMYIVARDPVSGTLVKLPGKVVPNPATGQLVSTFEDTPQLPFEELEVHFFGGERAPLSTPPLCGAYTTNASFTPWSGNPPVRSSSRFDITSGAHHEPCQDPQPFVPGFNAGATNVQAGAFTPFTTTVTRPDADQALGRIALRMPEGLSAMLSSVKLCEEPQAAEGTCGSQSLIGHTTISAGLGSDPLTVEGGQVFITVPYAGAPFGLSIVDPAVAGPFDLGKVVVRAKVEVDPETAAVSVLSEPLPTMLKGIPLQLQNVNVTIDRPGFTFNPTDCEKLSLTGTITSSAGVSANVASPFQVTDCAALAFKPAFSVSTSAHTSKAKGASLDVRLSYPNMPQGTQANLAKVKVDLPRALPSRLTTLQRACTEAQFAAGPATHCPEASRVGTAIVHTPVLPVPLSGVAYFVSHGGAKFPELVIVLEGDGVRIDLHGETFISKQGITSSTFNETPDVPFSSFELKLPEGSHSALTTQANLCTQKLAMPTTFEAQDGATIHQSTPVSVTGCPHKRPLTRAARLAAALRTCRKHDRANRRKRQACEAAARKRYGSHKAK